MELLGAQRQGQVGHRVKILESGIKVLADSLHMGQMSNSGMMRVSDVGIDA